MSISTRSFSQPYSSTYGQSATPAFDSVEANLLRAPVVQANSVTAYTSVQTPLLDTSVVTAANVQTATLAVTGPGISVQVSNNAIIGGALTANSAQVTTSLGADTMIAQSVESEEVLAVPRDKRSPAVAYVLKDGCLQYDSATKSLEVFSGEWNPVGSKSAVPETVSTLIPGSGEPVDFVQVLNLFGSGTVYNVNDEASFAAALAAAADDDTIRLTANITLTNQYTISKELIFDLSGRQLFVPWVSNTYSFLITGANKDVVFQGGGIVYGSGSAAGSSTTLFACNANTRLFLSSTLVQYGEFCVTGTSNSIYANNVIFQYVGGKGQSGSNSYRTVLCSGATTTAHYLYFANCIFDAVTANGNENLRVVFYNTGGGVSVTGGSLTFTNCEFRSPHRIQALAFYESCLGGPARGSHQLQIDNCVLDSQGARNQLALIFSNPGPHTPLNSFDHITLKHNTFQRHDDDKGLLYLDISGTYPAGSTDVFIFKNVTAPLAAPGATRQLISVDGIVRGATTVYGVHLQKHR